MLTILSALGGLATSLLPDVIHGLLGARQDARDKAHELAMLERVAAHKMEEIQVQADIAESAALEKRVAVVGVRWVDALNASVRPVVTYAFFLLFAWHLITQGSVAAIPGVWTEEIQALFSGIMGFWFGNRSMKAARGR